MPSRRGSCLGGDVSVDVSLVVVTIGEGVVNLRQRELAELGGQLFGEPFRT